MKFLVEIRWSGHITQIRPKWLPKLLQCGLFLIIFFLIVQETCIQFNFINWWIFSWIWEHFINISHWIVCFYKDCPITGTCCKRNLISTRAWAIEKLLREIEITLLSLWQFSFNLVTAGFTLSNKHFFDWWFSISPFSVKKIKVKKITTRKSE